MRRFRMSVVCVLLLCPALAGAGDLVRVPQGTTVSLALESPLSTREAAEGDRVMLTVQDDVWVGTRLVVRKGESVEAIITDVGRPGSFGRSGRISLQFGSVRAVDGKKLDLMPWDRETLQRVGYAAGAAVGGVAVLGPVGAVGGIFVKGRHLEYPAGHVLNAAVRWEYAVEAPPPDFLTAGRPAGPAAVEEPAPEQPQPETASEAGPPPSAPEESGTPAGAAPGPAQAPGKGPVAPVIPIIEDVTDTAP